MKHIVIVFLIVIASDAIAQNDVLFRVVSFSEGVTIDGTEPQAGADVTKDKKRIDVPPGGYLGGITKDGEVFKITQSTNVSRVMSNNRMKTPVQFHYAYQYYIAVSGVSKGNPEVVGDNIFLNWKVNYEDPEDSVTIKFSDVFYNELASMKVKNSPVLLDISPLLAQSPNVVFELSYRFNLKGRNPKEARSALLTIRRPTPERSAGIQFDLQRLPQTADRLYYESALYLLNDLTYDSGVCLYTIMKSAQTTPDPVLMKYYQVMFERNELRSVPR